MTSTSTDLDVETRRLVVTLNEAAAMLDTHNAESVMDHTITMAAHRPLALSRLRRIREEYTDDADRPGFDRVVAAVQSLRVVARQILAGRL